MMSYPLRQTPKYARIKSQRGVALISVLLAVALCVILASEMLMQQSLQVKRVQNLFERQQAFWYANGSEQFVKTLIKKIIDDDAGVIHLDQSWAMTGMSFPVPDGLIEGQISDLQSCFNINSLYNSQWDQKRREEHKQAFVRLLDKLDIVKDNSSEDLANNVYDWLDPDEYPVGAVGYDGDMYTSMPFPYMAANSPFAHENELRLVYGFDAAVMAQLDDTLCAIPDYSDFVINVNTIDAENPVILAAVLDIDNSTAENIISQRPKDGFKDIKEFWDLNEVKSLKNLAQIDKTQFTVKSKFFKLVTNAYYNDMRFDLTSVMQLNEQNEIQVIARRFGGKVERKADPETEQSDN
ncbi:MAG: type II secretion system minor pseudopilin GspK [Gammaproteobacteria bacterium]|nr:type II secretion system minor pseudopilin GspK [Gammaproteobacteria bacterium]